jgi:serine protease Do
MESSRIVAWGGSLVLAGLVGAAVSPWAHSNGAQVGAPCPDFAAIAEHANPAVVQVATLDRRQSPDVAWEPGDAPAWRGDGSGVVIAPEGYVLTNHHLVAASTRIRVRLADHRDLPARLVGTDASTDLALLKINAGHLPFLEMGDSDRLRVGDWVCAIGNPLRFEHSVTVGVVSSKGRKIFDASFDAYIQTDAAINPGSSGGPLVDAAGKVVGINAAVSREGQGIGFAIPINVARSILTALLRDGRVARGYLGVGLEDGDADLVRFLKAPPGGGALVLDVKPSSPGARAGLRCYDLVRTVDGSGIENSDTLIHVIASSPPGKEVRLGIWRDGAPLSLTARLGERADEDGGEQQSAAPAPIRSADALGLVIADPSLEVAQALRATVGQTGVVIEEVLGLSSGADLLDSGDIVLEVNRQPTPNLQTYQAAVRAIPGGQPAWVRVYRPRPAGTFLARLEKENVRP